MFPLAFAVLLVLPVSPSGISPSHCARTLSAVGEAIFAGSHGFELEIQRECLVWEASVQPKAQFIPPSIARARPDPIVRRSLELVRPGWPTSFSESLLGRGAFHIGSPLLLFGPGLGVPTPSNLGR
jgi:hypothetical protein